MTALPRARPPWRELAALMSARAGLSVPAIRRANLERGAQQVMNRFHLATPDALLEAVRDREPVFLAMMSEITVGETYFFREPGHFRFLREQVLPELIRARGPQGAVRAWSAGCSSGEEAYSLAALFADMGLSAHARVEATDISPAGLFKAKAGSYGPWSLRGDGAAAISPWLVRANRRFLVTGELRERVRFSLLNLADDAWPSDHGAFDIVMCRNVLIYLDETTISRVSRRLGATLLPGGVLITGPSDPLVGEHAGLETLITSAGIVYRKASPSGAAFGQRDAESPEAPFEYAPAAASEPENASPSAAPRRAVAQRGAPEPGEAPPARTASPAAPRGVSAPNLSETESEIRRLTGIGASVEAEALLAEALLHHPASLELHFHAAMLHLSVQAFTPAERELRRIVYLDRAVPVAHFALGTLLLRTARPDAALRAFRNACALARDRPPLECLRLGGGETAERLAHAAAAHVRALSNGAEP